MQTSAITETGDYAGYGASRTQALSDGFKQVLEKKQEFGMDAREFLKSLSVSELYEIQKANHLAGRINIQTLSTEGAENLFLMPVDKYQAVDLNNDGLVEVGAGKNFIFPPPNSPESVKDAWKEVSKNMTFKERMLVEGRFLAKQLEANSYRKPDGTWGVHDPGDEGWVNIFGDSEGTMIRLCNEIIYRIDNPLQNPSEEQRKRDEYVKDILTRFILRM